MNATLEKIHLNHHNDYRRSATSDNVDVLSEIYRDDTNIAIWQRQLSDSVKDTVNQLIDNDITISSTVQPDTVISTLTDNRLSITNPSLSELVFELVDTFCRLFEQSHVGLRISTLHNAMCPKFHVDRLPCRLVTTLHGVGTEWLPHDVVDRSKLGTGSLGLPDDRSGLYNSSTDIQQLTTGDVALLKGELWKGNEGAGLVHRSPTVCPSEKRVLLTLDFIN